MYADVQNFTGKRNMIGLKLKLLLSLFYVAQESGGKIVIRRFENPKFREIGTPLHMEIQIKLKILLAD